MEDVNTYHIRVRGPVEEDDLNAGSPLRLVVVESGPESALLTVSADQAGMVGLIRHLHGLGFVLLAVIRCPEERKL
ncbi:MAG: hypothetical protein EHM21_07865 [Chloroflexi bacterium]|nr:MAG: hypothetical protein EHM21_07865 [Chloroflexota bacterium]